MRNAFSEQPEDRSLEVDRETMERWTNHLARVLGRHIESLPSQPAGYDTAKPRAASKPEPLPESGASFEDLVRLVVDELLPESFNTAGPGYLAYIPGGGLYQAALGEFLAAALNRYVGVSQAAPGLVALEAQVLRWLADIIGYGPDARGILTSGGSLANFSAVVAARREHLGYELRSGVVYASTQVHHSVVKAALLAGLAPEAVRSVPVDGAFRMRIDALEDAIVADRARGLRPFLVVGSGGTTNTGAVDDLSRLADVAERHGLWFHVDAAYGGFFLLTDRGREVLRGIDRADSVVLDPHKGLFLPYGTGALVVKDGEALRRAHAVHAEYLPPAADGAVDPLLVDFSEYSPELSRGFRGLSVWLPLKLHGIGVFRRNLDEKLDLARRAHGRLAQMKGIAVVAAPELSITAFRAVRPGLDGEAENALNRRLLAAVLSHQRVWLTHTVLDGRFTIRICVLSFRTHADRLDLALDLIERENARL